MKTYTLWPIKKRDVDIYHVGFIDHGAGVHLTETHATLSRAHEKTTHQSASITNIDEQIAWLDIINNGIVILLREGYELKRIHCKMYNRQF